MRTLEDAGLTFMGPRGRPMQGAAACKKDEAKRTALRERVSGIGRRRRRTRTLLRKCPTMEARCSRPATTPAST
ncbi:MAG: hypothetical protein U0325_17175 [Polyangiales bacterium]